MKAIDAVVEPVMANRRQACLDKNAVDAISSVSAETSPQLVFVSATGKAITSDLWPQFAPGVSDDAVEALAQAAPAVHAKTAVTRWGGEPCHYGMVIESLLQRDGLF